MNFESLIQLPESRRDDQWEQLFLSEIVGTNVQLDKPDPQGGPDGWPYLLVRTSGAGTEPFAKVVQWAANAGVGIAINPHKMMPDYVFTYGMLWNYVKTGRFVAPIPQGSTGEVSYSADEKLISGAPTEDYLPAFVRVILREFLHSKGAVNPKVLVISNADFSKVDLVFSREGLGLPSTSSANVARLMTWFLPLHYNLVLASEESMPPFHPL